MINFGFIRFCKAGAHSQQKVLLHGLKILLMPNKEALFKPDTNCSAVAKANFAAPVVDCANYYKALHESICNARQSIYIVGWDIDSRIRLLRGDDEKNSEWPSTIIDLISKKAEDNPDLDVRLLRWDSSFAFMGMREVWAKEVWDEGTPENVRTMLDCSIPMGGSQHQKIVIIDSEIAFTGGMDVAVHRWDTREHKIDEPERNDGDGEYGPFHDVQMLLSGKVVKHLGELVQWRWNRLLVDDESPIKPLQYRDEDDLPRSWPVSVKPVFQDIECAIAQTVPRMDDTKPKKQVREMLLELIEQARRFIYIENQFANNLDIAKALNKQLKAFPELRVLILSSYKPEGAVETEAYWAGRIDFKKTLEDGIDKRQVFMAYSSFTDIGGQEEQKEGQLDGQKEGQKRVHAKVMVVDDEYFVVGSSNLSKRSMTLDTECDVTFHATNRNQREGVAWFRNDLISEHSGWSVDEVESFIEGDETFVRLRECKDEYSYCLKEANDAAFTDKKLQSVITPIGDPVEPIIPSLPLPNGEKLHVPNPSKKSLILVAFLIVIFALSGLGYFLSHYVDWMNQEYLVEQLRSFRDSPWAIILVCAIYMLAGLLFFPVSVLSLAVAMVFGAMWGVVFGMAGAMASTLLLFTIGQFVGKRGLKSLIGPRMNKIDQQFAKNGILGVAIIRNIPVAPFSLVNMVAGVSSIKLHQFMLGTFIGMLPLMIVKASVGGSIADILREPNAKHIAFLVVGVFAWLLVAFASQKLINYLQDKGNKSKRKKSFDNQSRENSELHRPNKESKTFKKTPVNQSNGRSTACEEADEGRKKVEGSRA